ncbi:MAG TPA: mobile mystery protein A [Longimicrobium sp.]
MTTSFGRLRRKHLDTLVTALIPIRRMSPPPRGWVNEIRATIGLTSAQLGARMGVSQSAVSQLERREAEGSLTLNSLRAAADALECDLVYALVPREGSITAMMEKRARAVAAATVARVSHTMRLEDQGIDAAAMGEQVEELARDLIDDPRSLWTDDVG